MGEIVLLDELTINKIAAGEVIERPASVIKEMMENSIDAGAKNIFVEIKNGGISYIRITDDGKGIDPSDIDLCFERHATSKIRSADDLENVRSMGFRGEALASIAAISRIEMISRTKDYDTAVRITVEAGKVIEKEEAALGIGTTITVQNLFFNTPVRYKFLKKDYTESGYIEDIITRLALIHPDIAFQFINENKTIIQTSGNGNLKEVIYQIYGKDIANGILEINYQYEDMIITGVVGKPEIARSNRSNQIFFVNQRYVKDKTLSSAVEQAFKGMLPIGKYGFVILNIELPGKSVDVNVHPAKLEVRFEEENKVFKAVYHGLKETLLKGDLVYSNVIETEESKEEQTVPSQNETITTPVEEEVQNQPDDLQPQIETSSDIADHTEDTKVDSDTAQSAEESEDKENLIEQIYNEKMHNTIETERTPNEESNIEATLLESMEKLKEMQKALKKDATVDLKNVIEEANKLDMKEKVERLSENILSSDYSNFEEMYVKTFGKKPDHTEEKQEAEQEAGTLELLKDNNISVFEESETYTVKPNYKFIGIAFSTYIIIEIEKELYIIDQHAAHERIVYEKIKKNFYNETQKDSQMLLLPDVITLTHKEKDILIENLEVFEKAGFTLEEFGENTIKLTGAPEVCIELDTKELFLETLDEINTVARTAKQEIEEKFIATIACKAAVKANMSLKEEEVEKLMEQLLILPNPFTCPHGRPTAMKFSKTDIEKKFSRR